MKCTKCSHRWQKGSMTFSSACPKCQSDSKPENISEALWLVFITAGPMYLQDSKKLLSVFADLAPELKKERNLLEMFIHIKGPEKLIQAANSGDAENTVQILVRDLRDNYGMHDGTAEQLCRAYLAALTGNVIDMDDAHTRAAQPEMPKTIKKIKPDLPKAETAPAEVRFDHDPLPGEALPSSGVQTNGWFYGPGALLGFGAASWFWGSMWHRMIVMITHEGRAFHPTLIYHFLFAAACAAVGLLCHKKMPVKQLPLWSLIVMHAVGAGAHENLRYIFLMIGPHFAGWGFMALLFVPLIAYLLAVYFAWQKKGDAASKDLRMGMSALLGTVFSTCWLAFALYFCRGFETILGWMAAGYIGIGIGVFMLSRLQGTFRIHCDRIASGIYLAYFAAALYWLLIGYGRFGDLSSMLMILLALPTLGLSLWKSGILQKLSSKL